MWKAFDGVMRIVCSLVGLAMMALGGVFILQGLNLAFNGPINGGPRSFMVGDPHWILYGSIFAVLGLGQLVWTLRRRA